MLWVFFWVRAELIIVAGWELRLFKKRGILSGDVLSLKLKLLKAQKQTRIFNLCEEKIVFYFFFG